MGMIAEMRQAVSKPGITNEVSNLPSRDLVQLAVTLRGLRQQTNASSFFFAPVSPGSGWFVHQLADALARIDPMSILVVNLRAGTVDAFGLGPDSPAALSLYIDLKQLASDLPALPPAEDRSLLKVAEQVNIPAQVLPAEKFLPFIAEARRCFGYVLIDGPNLIAEPVGTVAASQCDGTILTIAQGGSKLREVTKLKRQLERANARVVGFVMEES